MSIVWTNFVKTVENSAICLVIMWKQVDFTEFYMIQSENGWNQVEFNWNSLDFSEICLKTIRINVFRAEFEWNSSVCVRLYSVHPILWSRSKNFFDANKKSDNRTHERLHTREPLFRIENQFRGSVGLLFQKWRLKFRFARIPCPTYTANAHDAMKQCRMADKIDFSNNFWYNIYIN